jgi:hypothetical protein
MNFSACLPINLINGFDILRIKFGSKTQTPALLPKIELVKIAKGNHAYEAQG